MQLFLQMGRFCCIHTTKPPNGCHLFQQMKIRDKFKECIQIINEKRLKAQEKKQKELERIERERLKKAEDMTNDICFNGVWQSEKQAMRVFQD